MREQFDMYDSFIPVSLAFNAKTRVNGTLKV